MRNLICLIAFCVVVGIGVTVWTALAIPEKADMRALLPEDAEIAEIPGSYTVENGEVVPQNFGPAILPITLPDGRAGVVVGYYQPVEYPFLIRESEPGQEPRKIPVIPNTRCHLSVFVKDGEAWKEVWSARPWGKTFDVLGGQCREVAAGSLPAESLLPPVSLMDLTGSGTPELIVSVTVSPNIAIGGYLVAVFSFAPQLGRQVFTADIRRLQVVDLDDDGKMEIVTVESGGWIADGLADVWRWTGSEFKKDNYGFPEFYVAEAERLKNKRTLHGQAPADMFLNLQIATALSRAGQPEKASNLASGVASTSMHQITLYLEMAADAHRVIGDAMQDWFGLTPELPRLDILHEYVEAARFLCKAREAAGVPYSGPSDEAQAYLFFAAHCEERGWTELAAKASAQAQHLH